MSGKPWREERKRAWSDRMRASWRAGVYSRRKLPCISEAERLRRLARMKLLNIRMRDNDALRAKCIRGQHRARREPAFRAIQSAVMKAVMARPEMRRLARQHASRINRNPVVRRKQWATRRRKAKECR